MKEPYYKAKTSEIIGKIFFAEKTSAWPNSTIRSESKVVIGEKTNIQDNAVIHSKGEERTKIGKNVTIGHSAVVHGATIRKNSLIGINSTILTDAEIGENSLIAANALVPEEKSFPSNSVIMGVPGKVVRKIKEEEIKMIKERAEEYYQLAKKYKNKKKQ